MATVTDIMPLAQALWVIDQRLRFHTGDGEMLDGMTYAHATEIKEDGEKDLPYIRLFDFTLEEGLGVGGHSRRDGLPVPSRGNQPASVTLTAQYMVACRLKHGMFRLDPDDASDGKGLVEWLALVCDAIEIDTDGKVDSRLGNTTDVPVAFSVGETQRTGLSWSLVLNVTVELVSVGRGERSVAPA